MSPVLPLHPNLDHLKKQAKDLLRSYRSGNVQVCRSIQQHLARFSHRTDREILAAGISLHDAQHVIAREYGFDNWSALRLAIAQNAEVGSHSGSSVLGPEEIASLAEFGHVRVRQAFPSEAALEIQDFMWSELNRLHGFERDDPSSWTLEGWTPSTRPSAWTRLRLNTSKDHSVYKAIASPRLMGAYAQLAGPEKAAQKQSWGAFPVRFPERGDQPWGIPSTGWHVVPHMRVITFFSHVGPCGGAPLLVEGSHRLVTSFYDHLSTRDRQRKPSALDNRFARSHPWLAELSGKAPDQGERMRRFMEEKTLIDGVPVRVVELIGEPGDAVFCHPATYQNSSPNRTDAPSFIRG